MQTKTSGKLRYRLRNWREYNAALVQRGSLTFWIDEEVLEHWCAPAVARRGRRRLLSEEALQALFMLQAFFGLPLRALEGLSRSILTLLKVELPVPDYSTLCRRRQTLEGKLFAMPRRGGKEALHLVIDSSGLKVFGEGEWKVRQHGIGKRRTWRKLHLALDESSGEILAAAASGAEVADAHALPLLLAQVEEPIAQASADGAFDHARCYEMLAGYGVKRVTIPPRRRACIWQHGNRKGPCHLRDENLRGIRARGRAAWKRQSGYHRRSLAENAFFRLKTSFGERLAARKFPAQANEALIRCAALNKLTQLGRPQSYAVAA